MEIRDIIFAISIFICLISSIIFLILALVNFNAMFGIISMIISAIGYILASDI